MASGEIYAVIIGSPTLTHIPLINAALESARNGKVVKVGF
jgi:predicted dehydrogenase